MSNTNNDASKTKHACCSNKKAPSGKVTAIKDKPKQQKVDIPSSANAQSNKTEEHHLIIDGASCASCVTKIEKALRAVDGVQSAEMNFAQSDYRSRNCRL
jgi:Cu+-exporting ATPase